MRKQMNRELQLLFKVVRCSRRAPFIAACMLALVMNTGITAFGAETEFQDMASKGIKLDVSEKSYTIFEPVEDADFPYDGMEVQISIDGNLTKGYVRKGESENDDSPEFCYFYGMNEAGKTSVYRYDMKEKTMQRYVSASVSNEPYEQLNAQYKQLVKDYNAQVQENERLRIQLFTATLSNFLH